MAIALAMSTWATSHAQTDSLWSQEGPALFTIYLVRHAEKQTAVSDPPLTSCGKERAVSLKEFLSDIPIDVVYSTDFKRTRGTAAPVADAKALEIQSYAPHALEALKETLMANNKMRSLLDTAIPPLSWRACSSVMRWGRLTRPSTTASIRLWCQKSNGACMSSTRHLSATMKRENKNPCSARGDIIS